MRVAKAPPIDEGSPGAQLPVSCPALQETAQTADSPPARLSALVCAKRLSQNQQCVREPDLKGEGGILLNLHVENVSQLTGAPSRASTATREEEQSQGCSLPQASYVWAAAQRALSK